MKVLVILCMLVAGTKAQVGYQIDCIGQSDTCLNSGVCDMTSRGICITCAPGFTGYDCGTPTPGVACTSLNCGANGQCDETTGGSPVCICNEGYLPDLTATGEICVPRVRLTDCGATSMSFKADMFDGFGTAPGYVYLAGTVDPVPTNCYFAGSNPYTMTYLLSNPECTGGTALVPDTATEPGYSLYTLKVRVQHATDSFGGTKDFDVETTCRYTLSGTAYVAVSSSVTVQMPAAGLPALASSTDSDSGLTVEAQDPTGTVLSGAQDVGAAAQVQVTLDTTKGFAEFRLDSLRAENADGSVTKDLMLGGCVLRSALTVVTGLATINAAGAYIVNVPIKIFAFADGTPVKFVATSTLCTTAGDATCAPTPCTGATEVPPAHPDFTNEAGVGRRRKRQVSTGNTVEKQLNVTYFIIDPRVYQDNMPFPDPMEYCHQNIAFLLPVIILAILLVFAVAFAIFFCVKATRKDPIDAKGMPNMAYKA